MTGEMSIEEWLVYGDVFYSDDSFLWLEFYDFIDEEEWVSMGKKIHDTVYIEYRWGSGGQG